MVAVAQSFNIYQVSKYPYTSRNIDNSIVVGCRVRFSVGAIDDTSRSSSSTYLTKPGQHYLRLTSLWPHHDFEFRDSFRLVWYVFSVSPRYNHKWMRLKQ